MNQSLKVLAVQILAIALIGAAFIFIPGCKAPEKRKPITLPPKVADAAPKARAVVVSINKPLTTLEKVFADAQQLPESELKVRIVSGLTLAMKEVGEAKAAAVEAVTAVEAKDTEAKELRVVAVTQGEVITAQDKKIDDLQKPNPVIFWFYLIGGGLLAAGITIMALALLPWTSAAFGKAFGWGAGGAIVGLVLITFAYFFVPIIWACGIALGLIALAGVAWLARYAWKKWKYGTVLVKSLEEGKRPDGTLDWEKVNEVQSAIPGLKKFVDTVQKKLEVDSPMNITTEAK
jgi:hypothetical protein